jgi:hemolysin activation/secretion protein
MRAENKNRKSRGAALAAKAKVTAIAASVAAISLAASSGSAWAQARPAGLQSGLLSAGPATPSAGAGIGAGPGIGAPGPGAPGSGPSLPGGLPGGGGPEGALAPLALPQTPGSGSPEQTLPQTGIGTRPKPPKATLGAPQAPAPSGLDRQVQIESLQIEGVKAIPFEKAKALFAPLAKKTVAVQQLVGACDQLTKLYQQEGYALSFCFVPQQDFANGVARVVAVEGRASSLEIKGDAGPLKKRIEQLAAPLLAEAPLKMKSFERMATLLSQLPGAKVVAKIDPPTKTDGLSVLQVEVQKRRGWDVSAGLDLNHPGVQALITAVENGELGLGEQISVGALVPPGQQEQKYYFAKWSQPIGAQGMALNFGASSYRAQPTNPAGYPYYVESLQSEDKIYAELSYPFKLTQTESLVGGVGVYAARESSAIQNNLSGLEAGQRDSIRVANARLTWNKSGTNTTDAAEFTIARGVNALGAHKEGFSNFGAEIADTTDLSFWKLGLTGAHVRQWSNGWGYQLAFASQWSPNSLPSAEQIAFGSTRFGLGYPAGASSGDSGIGGSAQVFKSFNIGSKWLKTVAPYLAIDGARLWLAQGTPSPAKMASIGIGTRVSDGQHYSLDLSVAKPIGQAPATTAPDRPWRVNALFSYDFR